MIFKQLMPSAMQLTMSCLDGNEQFKMTIRNTNKKMTDVMKEKLNPLVEEYKRINSKPNFSAIRVLFLLNFWKSRKCALN